MEFRAGSLALLALGAMGSLEEVVRTGRLEGFCGRWVAVSGKSDISVLIDDIISLRIGLSRMILAWLPKVSSSLRGLSSSDFLFHLRPSGITSPPSGLCLLVWYLACFILKHDFSCPNFTSKVLEAEVCWVLWGTRVYATKNGWLVTGANETVHVEVRQ
jgi:hypothetical protein